MCAPLAAQDGTPPFRNHDLPVADRVADLVGRLTLEEKIAQMQHEASAIERLGIPPYTWWNEALHGVARAGTATVFPQAIGLAACFDADLLHSIATAIGVEARAKHHEALRQGRHGIYEGLTFWSPNINIARDPRWGRGQETYGEDPWLAGTLGAAFVRGLQGDDPAHLRAVATPKHFAVHSGPEPTRHAFNASVSETDLRDTYLPAFARTVREAGAASVMCAYNRLYGDPCCASTLLLDSILRAEWGFDGYVVSDCWAVSDYVNFHHSDTSMVEAAARSVNAGCDLTCGPEYAALGEAVRRGLVAPAVIDRAARRLFTARMRLGMFDPPGRDPYAAIPYSKNACERHDSLALHAAERSIVLLKNNGGTLPLSRDIRRIAVLGPAADDSTVLLGNYNGTPPYAVTLLRGLRARAGSDVAITYTRGCDLAEGRHTDSSAAAAEQLLIDAQKAASDADAVIVVLGLHPWLEGEELRVALDGFRGGDRTTIELPAPQERLLRAVQKRGRPLIVVLLSGSAIVSSWMSESADAILAAWYPGQRGGDAVAHVLFGDVNPSGRLPVTFYASTRDLPPFEDYSMRGRTYRFFHGTPQYAFGHGLSYTEFAYSDLRVSADSLADHEELTILVTVENTGQLDGTEIAQLYIRDTDAPAGAALRTLRGVRRVDLERGGRRRIAWTLTADDRRFWDATSRSFRHPRRLNIIVGSSSADERLRTTVRF
ncbi:MAG: glycoside hydrolase family 3 C-terminal domain-containing protein [Ignavibacteriae bacterium]|nr:glycoside hydrolase family 3 C-terminal domain-containing protein [Ignavibacteriota bacterium]